MVTRTAPSRLTPQERARRAARGGASRSVPAPLLAPALVAVAFLLLPLAGLLIRAPWGHMAAALSGSDATQALTLSLWTASVSTGVSLVTVADRQIPYAREVLEVLRKRGFRAELDERGMTMNAKIREAQLHKVPFTLVIGDREVEQRAVAPRRYGGEDLKTMPLDAFLELLTKEGAPPA